MGLIAQRLPFSSLFSIIAGYGTLYALASANSEQREMAIGFGAVALLILIHAVLGHRKRNRVVES